MDDRERARQADHTRCPHRACEQVFPIPEGFFGRPGRCPACGAALTLRPLFVWEAMERRELAYRAGDAAWLARREGAHLPPKGLRREAQCFHREAEETSEELRFDLRYEAGSDRPTPRIARCDELVVVLDDLRSQWNVGAIFRSAEGLGWGAVHLVGITPMPPAPGLSRVALGAEEQLPWDYHARVLELHAALVARGFTFVLLEQTDDAVDLEQLAVPEKLALVVGNEVGGVSAELLSCCPKRVAIPMAGQKASLNAAVAFGIAAHGLARAWRQAYAD